MTRLYCINNRNISIVAQYVESKIGRQPSLFERCTFPSHRYESPESFFFNEDEWTSLNNFRRVLRKAQELVGEPYLAFSCGASAALLRSWGRLDYFARVFKSPCDGYRKIPFFNRTLNNTKKIEIIVNPTYSKTLGKVRTLLKVEYHDNIDVNNEFLIDSYRRGIISAIPTIWGLGPAHVKQPLNPYDPEILFNNEPEFKPFALNARMADDFLVLRHPFHGRDRRVGKRILIRPDRLGDGMVYLGKYREYDLRKGPVRAGEKEAVLITETVKAGERILMRAGEIFKAPYFVLDVTYDRLSLFGRLSQTGKFRRPATETGVGMIETLDRIRETTVDRNLAFQKLEELNKELFAAKQRLEDYSHNLEKKVEVRTVALRKAQEKLMAFNRTLEAKVEEQVTELQRYSELRRYFSPKLCEKILSRGETVAVTPQRKMMTVLFSDIRNFSSFTDCLEPEETFYLLDLYLSEMTKLVYQYDGTLNKMMGDGLLVFFGDPYPMERHEEMAIKLAMDMQKKVTHLREEWRRFGFDLGIGIGINTGYMTVGNIGSDMHRDYTVIGNQVNVAARLESIAKAGQILISQRTHSKVESLIDAKAIGEIAVKGIRRPVTTYEVVI